MFQNPFETKLIILLASIQFQFIGLSFSLEHSINIDMVP